MISRLLAALAIALAATAAQAQPGPPPALDVVLKPWVANGAAAGIEVTQKVEAPGFKAGQRLLRLPMIFASVESARYEAKDIAVTDARGPVPLVQKDDPPDAAGFLYFRRWQAGRDTEGDITIRYRAPARTFIPKLGSGPPFDLRPEAGGLNGAGVTFMAVPDTNRPYRIHLSWDLAALPTGARGAWSMGEGEVRTVGPVEVLANAYYFVGDLKSAPTPSTGPFAMYWMTEPNFDMTEVGAFVTKTYAAVSAFFHEPNKPYRIFFRRNAAGSGGAGLVNSFLAGYSDNPRQSASGMRHYLAHEIVHNWPGGLEGTPGEIAWYGEGLAETYSITIPWRAGLISTEEYIEAINGAARSYFGNAVNTAPASEIAAKFWTDARVRKLPYDRGRFYLATVDAQVRAKSGGKRRLEDLVFAMLERRKQGKSYDTEAWLGLVTAELGPQARTEWQAMMAGKLQVAPSDAFGPCFRREPTQVRRFELGFDQAVLSSDGRVVRGLVAGSEAAKAGLRDGDVLVAPPALEPVQAEETKTLTLNVTRTGQPVAITYLPRGPAVAGYKWVRIAGVPDANCGI